MVRNCAPENLEIPGLAPTSGAFATLWCHPGMTNIPAFSRQCSIFALAERREAS